MMSQTAESVSATLTQYSEKREATARLEVTGAPPLRHSAVARVLTPSSVHLTYTKTDHGHWRVHARVYGLPTTGSQLLNDWADFRKPVNGWPDWLREIADQRHPDRPGGWPGTDPNGSYL